MGAIVGPFSGGAGGDNSSDSDHTELDDEVPQGHKGPGTHLWHRANTGIVGYMDADHASQYH